MSVLGRSAHGESRRRHDSLSVPGGGRGGLAVRSLLARVLGVREDEVDDVVRHDRRGAERALGRRGFLGAVAAVAASVALPESDPAGLIQVATPEQVVTYSFPSGGLCDLGYSSRKVIAAFLDAYHLQLRSCRRFALVDESLVAP